MSAEDQEPFFCPNPSQFFLEADLIFVGTVSDFHDTSKQTGTTNDSIRYSGTIHPTTVVSGKIIKDIRYEIAFPISGGISDFGHDGWSLLYFHPPRDHIVASLKIDTVLGGELPYMIGTRFRTKPVASCLPILANQVDEVSTALALVNSYKGDFSNLIGIYQRISRAHNDTEKRLLAAILLNDAKTNDDSISGLLSYCLEKTQPFDLRLMAAKRCDRCFGKAEIIVPLLMAIYADTTDDPSLRVAAINSIAAILAVAKTTPDLSKNALDLVNDQKCATIGDVKYQFLKNYTGDKLQSLMGESFFDKKIAISRQSILKSINP